MITENRLKHMIGVARKCYALSKEMGHDEDFSRTMWVVGLLHDIGYEFDEDNHEAMSSLLVQSLGEVRPEIVDAIKHHGKYGDKNNIVWEILIKGDLQVDSEGKEVDVIARLNDIKERHGEFSDAYLTSCDNAYVVRLTPYNLAGHIT